MSRIVALVASLLIWVRSFTGFGRPWNHLEELIEDIHVREVALGSGYILTGQAPRSRRRG